MDTNHTQSERSPSFRHAGGTVGSVWVSVGSDGKVSDGNVGDPEFNPWVGKIPSRRKWQPTPVLFPGKFHGLRSLVGYSPWGRKESDMIE